MRKRAECTKEVPFLASGRGVDGGGHRVPAPWPVLRFSGGSYEGIIGQVLGGLGRGCDCGGVVAATHDLIGDHGAEQERTLQDLADLRRDPDGPRRCVARSIVAHDDRSRGDADGVVPAEEGEAEAGEAEHGRKGIAVLQEARVGQQERQADHAGDGARHEQVINTIRSGLTPAARAATGFMPDSFNS